MNIAVAVLLLAAVAYVHALPGGPPMQACTNIFPVGHTNPANAVAAPNDNVNSPYQLDLQGFRNESDPQSFRYYPGGQYTLTITAPSDDMPYRGLMVQARTVADGTPVGTFSDFTSNTQQSVCPDPTSAVTHNSRADKTCELLTWTAPENGTGPIQFLYAVVVRFTPGTVNMFYATLVTEPIEESPLPPSGDNPTCDMDDGGATVAQALSFWTLMVVALFMGLSRLL